MKFIFNRRMGWKEEQLTTGYKGLKFAPVWSPDSKKIAWSDKDVQVWYVDVADKKPVLIEKPVKSGAYSKDVFGEVTDYTWSPDSKWISYSKPSENGNTGRICIRWPARRSRL